MELAVFFIELCRGSHNIFGPKKPQHKAHNSRSKIQLTLRREDAPGGRSFRQVLQCECEPGDGPPGSGVCVYLEESRCSAGFNLLSAYGVGAPGFVDFRQFGAMDARAGVWNAFPVRT